MAITLETNARNAAASAVGALANGGKLQLLTAANATVAEATLTNPAFGAAATGVITAATIPDMTVGTAGTVAKFRLVTSAAATILEGMVATSGADLNLDKLAFTVGEIIRVTSLTVTMPATV